MSIKITPQDYHALADKRGFKWLGPMVDRTSEKTKWQCKKGHKWEALYQNVKGRGSGCPVCVTLNKKGNQVRPNKKTPQDYHILAKERGLKWIGSFPQNTNTKTRWECKEGHQWEAKWGNIRSCKPGRGCRVCANKNPVVGSRKQPQDYHALAQKQGFKWLGPEVRATSQKTGWQCENGHNWETTYSSIAHKDTGCPVCFKTKMHGTPRTSPKPAAKKRKPKQGQSKATPEMIAKLHQGRAAAEARLETERARLEKIGIVSHNDQAAVLLYSRSKEEVEFKGEETEWTS